MRNEITFDKGNINGGTILKMRGGRKTSVIKDKTKYNRKPKHKGRQEW